LQRLGHDFAALAHQHQLPPAHANNGGPWTTWLMLGGRGAGKTRLGAEFVRALALGIAPYADAPHGSIALIGETDHDVREVMIEGPSGILRVGPWRERPAWSPSRGRLEWHNGAVAQVFSAEDPDALRGPQFHAAWCDEFAKWRRAQDVYDMLQFGLRLGERPRQLITTTPRSTKLITDLMTAPRTAVTRAATYANAAFLSPVFLSQVVQPYDGTRLGRQEILGEIVEDRPGALWTRAMIEGARVRAAPPLARIVVGIDPPAASRPGSDACGIVAAGRAEDGTIYVLEDATVAGLGPAGWAAKAIAVYHRLKADRIIAEVNQGGEMVAAVLRQVDASVPVKAGHATRGKYMRAEPVAAVYAQGKAKHVVPMPELEDQMCDLGPDGRLSSGASPDRLDALVWAVSELIRPRAEPRIRGFGVPGAPPWSVMSR